MSMLNPWPFARSGFNAPATLAEIEAAETEIGLIFPPDLRAFYLLSNGFDGTFDDTSAYIHINDLEEVVALSTGYDACVDIGGLIIFAGMGGNYVYVVDTLRDPPVYGGLSLFASNRAEIDILGESLEACLKSLSESHSSSARSGLA